MSAVFRVRSSVLCVLFYMCFLFLISMHEYFSFDFFYGYGSDLWVYNYEYNNLGFSLNIFNSPVYYFFSSTLSALGFSFEFFRASLFFVFFVAVVRQFYLFSNNHFLVFLFLIVALFYPVYISLSSLVLRQGLGVAFLMIIGFWGNSRSFIVHSFLVFLAALSHLSLLFYILPLYLSHKFSVLKFSLFFWVGVVIAYIMDVGIIIKDVLSVLLGFLGFPYVKYALIDFDYKLGFNVNFLLPSVVVLLFMVVAKLRFQFFSIQSLYLLRFFFFSNGVALLFSGFAYYDRLMIYSWILMPFIVLSLNSVPKIYKRCNVRCS